MADEAEGFGCGAGGGNASNELVAIGGFVVVVVVLVLVFVGFNFGGGARFFIACSMLHSSMNLGSNFVVGLFEYFGPSPPLVSSLLLAQQLLLPSPMLYSSSILIEIGIDIIEHCLSVI